MVRKTALSKKWRKKGMIPYPFKKSNKSTKRGQKSFKNKNQSRKRLISKMIWLIMITIIFRMLINWELKIRKIPSSQNSLIKSILIIWIICLMTGNADKTFCQILALTSTPTKKPRTGAKYATLSRIIISMKDWKITFWRNNSN